MLFPLIAVSAEPLERVRFRDTVGKLEARAKWRGKCPTNLLCLRFKFGHSPGGAAGY
jgi:hypothetical protein